MLLIDKLDYHFESRNHTTLYKSKAGYQLLVNIIPT